MIDHRLSLVSTGDLPEHLLPDVEHTLAHLGWLGLSATRREIEPAADAPTALAVIDYRGKVPPLVPTHADHDHDAMLAELISGLQALGLATLHVAGAAATTVPDLIVADMDSTFINDEGLDELAALARKGTEVAAVTEAAMRGELDFAGSLTQRVALLAGTDSDLIDEAQGRLTLTPGAATLAAAARDHGVRFGIVSGGFHEMIDPLLAEVGITRCAANRFEVADGTLTGAVAGPIVDAEAKANYLRIWAPGPYTVAIGDGANDIEMLRAASLGIAFDAKPALREVADVSVNVRRLDIVAALLGLR